MELLNPHMTLFYDLIACLVVAGSLWTKPSLKTWPYYLILFGGFLIGGLIGQCLFLTISSIIALLIGIYRYRIQIEKNRTIEVILVPDRDDHLLNYFLGFYKKDISAYFPSFDFNIEDEFLVALLFSDMESIGLIIAEIRDPQTLKICLDYIVPKHRNSELAKTFYLCELRCIDFLGYRQIYIEPQSKAHNEYLERIGFKLIDGKYVTYKTSK
jgi:hypothetical protein